MPEEAIQSARVTYNWRDDDEKKIKKVDPLLTNHPIAAQGEVCPAPGGTGPLPWVTTRL